MGQRLGPNKVRVRGVLQPIRDALKLRNKQINNLTISSFWFYYLRASMILGLTLTLWVRRTINPPLVRLKITILIIILILRINSIKVILRGWRTFRKYPLLGAMRTVRQLISYEVILYLILLCFIFLTSRFNFYSVNFYKSNIIIFTSPIIFYLWVPAMLADLNRTPYDFREGERELVRGYNTEYGARGFTLIFLREYRNIAFFSLITAILFIQNYKIITTIFLFIIFSIIWIRATLPRLRFDKLIILAWKFFIPFGTIIFLIFLLQ